MIEILKLDIKRELVRMPNYQPEYNFSQLPPAEYSHYKSLAVSDVTDIWSCIKYYDSNGAMKFAAVEKTIGRAALNELLGIAEANYKRNLDLKFTDGVIQGMERAKVEQTIELNHKFTQYSFWKRLKLAFNPFNAFKYE